MLVGDMYQKAEQLEALIAYAEAHPDEYSSAEIAQQKALLAAELAALPFDKSVAPRLGRWNNGCVRRRRFYQRCHGRGVKRNSRQAIGNTNT